MQPCQSVELYMDLNSACICFWFWTKPIVCSDGN
ncbi:hypothetical protein NC652_010661 [Populus alba x Populus x berolinensis]|uniref:Uncharacterized protein n=1 Tax=Populus alba x Populus x berolinensis TaxID=444605 RepID=A0AAD6R1J2_9ROSI|nr:hypothetical protein NC652_010661 [Populus alba x Populus x berolinensis]KAJ7000025.1 hypothetical protein NC653_010704 [Populus alba x Populus x berolinensis]